MISENLRKAVRPTSMAMNIVWIGEFSSFAVYYFVVWMTTQHEGPVPELNPVLPIVFGAAAAMSLIAGIVLKFFAFSERWARKVLSQEPVGATSAAGTELTDGELKLARIAVRTLPVYIMSLGMINSCALFGMVLAIVQRNGNLFPPFLVAAVVGCALSFPRLETHLDETQVALRHSFGSR